MDGVTIQNWTPKIKLFCMLFKICLSDFTEENVPNNIQNTSIYRDQSCVVTRYIFPDCGNTIFRRSALFHEKALDSRSLFDTNKSRLSTSRPVLARRTPNETCSIRKVSCETMAAEQMREGGQREAEENRMKWWEIRQIKRPTDCCICWIGVRLLLRVSRKWGTEERWM